MICSLFRAHIRSASFRRAVAFVVAAASVLAAAPRTAAAQAPIGQSAFAQYLSTLNVGAGILGAAAGSTGDNGPATSATLNSPVSVAYDSAGNLYICDSAANVVRRVDAISGIITTYAGTGVAGTAKDGDGDTGPAVAATLNAPNAIFIDGNNNMYIDDSTDNRIRLVTVADGKINTVVNVGGLITYNGQSATPFVSTMVRGPNGFWVNPEGDLMVSDSGLNHNVVRIGAVATGNFTNLAGTAATITDTGDGGPAISSTFGGPRAAVSNDKGEYFVIDHTNNKIRSITQDGIIHTYAGVSGVTTAGYAGDGGPATASTMKAPSFAQSDVYGNLFIMDTGNNVIRVVDRTTGNISTVSFLINGLASPTLGGPQGIAFGPSGQFAIADFANHVVRTGNLNSTFAPTTIGTTSAATNFTLQVNGTTADGVAAPTVVSAGDFSLGAIGTIGSIPCTFPLTTVVSSPAIPVNCTLPVTFTPTAPGFRVGQLVTQDTTTGVKSILPLTGIGTAPAVNFAGGALTTYPTTAVTPGTIVSPKGIAFDALGNLYFANGDNTIRSLSPTGTVTIVAGTGTAGGTNDTTTSTGVVATSGALNNPSAVAIDPSGNIIIADTGNNVLREVSAEGGIMQTISFTNYNANQAIPGATLPTSLLKNPKGVATGQSGNIYIADTGNNVVRKLNRGSGLFTTLAGTGTAGFSGDGAAATLAQLSAPAGVAVDTAGNVFIADTGNNLIRKIAVGTGIITTVAGSATGTDADGIPATSATLNGPSQIVVDAAGNLYIASTGSSRVRRVSATTGTISTVAGTGLSGPQGLALDALGNVYVADTGNARFAKITQTTTTVAFGSVPQGNTSGIVSATVSNFGNTPLHFTGTFTVSSGFAHATGTGNDCSTTTPLAPGASCLLGITFSPASTGSKTGTVTITDDALNTASTQTISLTGTGASAPASVTVVSGNNQTSAPYGTFSNQFAVVVKDSTGGVLGGIPVTFTAPSTGATGVFANSSNTAQATTAPDGTASVSFSAGGTRGTVSITATVAGVATPATFTETIAGNPIPMVSVSYAPATNPITYGATMKVTATVTQPAGIIVPSGSVMVLDNGTPIYTLTLASGTATTPTITPTSGSHSYTVTYAGDSNFSAGSSATPAPLTVNPLAITAAANSTSAVYGTTPPTVTGTLTGVLPADVANVVPTFNGVNLGSPIALGTPVGVYQIATTLSGMAAANYTVSSTTGAVTITKAGTTSALTVNYANAGPGVSVIFTDTLTSATTGVPSGTVSFYDGATLLGTGTLTKGKTTFTTATLALGTHNITAVYGGDTNFTGSTSNVVSMVIANPDFSIALSPATVQVIQGQVGVESLTINTVGSFASTISLSCSNVPANSICVFTPASFTPTPFATAPITSQTGIISVQTSGPGYQALVQPGRNRIGGIGSELTFAGIFGLPALALVVFTSRRKRRTLRALATRGLLAMLIAVGAGHMIGCSSNVSAPLKAQVTPLGNTVITVTATTGTTTYTGTFNLNVVAKP